MISGWRVLILSLDQEMHHELLEKISAYDHERAHRRLSRQRLKGTGQWFLDHPDFIKWFNAEGSPSLWCSGKSIPRPIPKNKIVEAN